MRKIKLAMPIMALILGVGIVGTQSAFTTKASKRASVLYERTSPTGTDWRISTSSSCISSPNQLCKAYFDYDPNGFSDEYNREHLDAEQPVTDNGYVAP